MRTSMFFSSGKVTVAALVAALVLNTAVAGDCAGSKEVSTSENKPACGMQTAAGDTTCAGKTIYETAVAAGSFKTLTAALQAAGMVECPKAAKGPVTVFAPTDEAFAKLPKGTVENLLKAENKELLRSILAYHVVPGRVTAEQVTKLTKAGTVNGQQIDIKVAEGGVTVDAARVLKTDIMASNGIIHVIDTVLLPSTNDVVDTAVKAGSFGTLVAAVKAAGLVETLKGAGPFTVFAPSDEAFAKLPAGTVENLLKPENRTLLTSVLTYHVVPGRVFSCAAKTVNNVKTVQGQHVGISYCPKNGVMVDGARVLAADIDASNGVIHVIDKVILPNAADLVATAVNAGTFKTLGAALTAAQLVGALRGEGPYTVFAPNDEAFAKLPAGTVETLLKPENLGKLQAILKFHVVAGRVYAVDAIKAKSAQTLQGSSLTIAEAEGNVTINGAHVLRANLDASNGVIHVIDQVLLPAVEQTEAPITSRSAY